MKLTVPTKRLAEALQCVSGIVPAKHANDIYRCVRLAAGKELTLSATDGEVSIQRDVSEHDIKSPGVCLVPPQKLLAILRETQSDSIVLSTRKDSLIVTPDRDVFELRVPGADSFPTIPNWPTTASVVTCDGGPLSVALSRTIFATDESSTRYALAGVLFEADGSDLTLAATDSRRLSVVTIPASGEIEGRPVLPSKAARVATQSIDGEVRLAFTPNSVAVRSGQTEIHARLLEGRFPKYQDVIPRKFDHEIVMLCGPLLSAVRQSQIVLTEESRGVDFAFADGNLTLRGMGAEVGSSEIVLPVASSLDMTVTLDPRFVADWLKTLDASDQVTLQLVDPHSPTVWRHGSNPYVLMPLSREG